MDQHCIFEDTYSLIEDFLWENLKWYLRSCLRRVMRVPNVPGIALLSKTHCTHRPPSKARHLSEPLECCGQWHSALHASPPMSTLLANDGLHRTQTDHCMVILWLGYGRPVCDQLLTIEVLVYVKLWYLQFLWVEEKYLSCSSLALRVVLKNTIPINILVYVNFAYEYHIV